MVMVFMVMVMVFMVMVMVFMVMVMVLVVMVMMLVVMVMMVLTHHNTTTDLSNHAVWLHALTIQGKVCTSAVVPWNRCHHNKYRP